MFIIITVLNLFLGLGLTILVYAIVKNYQIRKYIEDYVKIETIYSIFYAVFNETIGIDEDSTFAVSKNQVEQLLKIINEKIEYYDEKNIGNLVVGELKESLEKRQLTLIEMAADLRRWIWVSQ